MSEAYHNLNRLLGSLGSLGSDEGSGLPLHTTGVRAKGDLTLGIYRKGRPDPWHSTDARECCGRADIVLGLVQQDKYLLTCYRYIEMNPVRAGMVSRPEEYRWSSYGANAWGDKSWIGKRTDTRGSAVQRGHRVDPRRAPNR